MVEMFKKYKSVIWYIIFGGLTTLINIYMYQLCSIHLQLDTILSNIYAWVLSVLFAYVTNRKLVFESKTSSIHGLMKEMTSFFGCRLATGILDIAIMYISVDLLGFNGLAMKCISNVIVIVANYVASKLVIFK